MPMNPMRLTIVTDAWTPQVNGVVRTLERTTGLLRQRGHAVTLLHPGLFRTMPMPSYPQIRLALDPRRLGGMLEASRPDALHIATEGPLGIAAKLWADRRNLAYTTSYHTRFPEYVAARLGFGTGPAYALMRWFHRHASAVMVATPSMQESLEARGVRRIVRWGRGVDTATFCPVGPLSTRMEGCRWPIFLNVGRVAVEKNLPAFYDLDLPGTKVQVGDGPMLDTYRRRYPDVVFLGGIEGPELAEIFRAGDVFVFSSRTDTFGLVLLESIASGVPVAAYPVTGPVDVVTDGLSGCLDNDLEKAARGALLMTWAPDEIRACAMSSSWDACTDQFESNLVPLYPTETVWHDD